MTSSLAIREVRGDDYETVYTLYENLFRSQIECTWGWHESWQRHNFSVNWRKCETRVVVSDRGIVGYIQTVRHTDHLFLKNIGLLASYRSKGIGSRIINDLKVAAQAGGLPIKLSVYVTNPRAEAFYARLGFKKTRRSDRFQDMVWRSADSSADS